MKSFIKFLNESVDDTSEQLEGLDPQKIKDLTYSLLLIFRGVPKTGRKKRLGVIDFTINLPDDFTDEEKSFAMSVLEKIKANHSKIFTDLYAKKFSPRHSGRAIFWTVPQKFRGIIPDPDPKLHMGMVSLNIRDDRKKLERLNNIL